MYDSVLGRLDLNRGDDLMKSYRVKMVLDGLGKETIIQANNALDARQLAEAQFPTATIMSVVED